VSRGRRGGEESKQEPVRWTAPLLPGPVVRGATTAASSPAPRDPSPPRGAPLHIVASSAGSAPGSPGGASEPRPDAGAVRGFVPQPLGPAAHPAISPILGLRSGGLDAVAGAVYPGSAAQPLNGTGPVVINASPPKTTPSPRLESRSGDLRPGGALRQGAPFQVLRSTTPPRNASSPVRLVSSPALGFRGVESSQNGGPWVGSGIDLRGVAEVRVVSSPVRRVSSPARSASSSPGTTLRSPTRRVTRVVSRVSSRPGIGRVDPAPSADAGLSESRGGYSRAASPYAVGRSREVATRISPPRLASDAGSWMGSPYAHPRSAGSSPTRSTGGQQPEASWYPGGPGFAGGHASTRRGLSGVRPQPADRPSCPDTPAARGKLSLDTTLTVDVPAFGGSFGRTDDSDPLVEEPLRLISEVESRLDKAQQLLADWRGRQRQREARRNAWAPGGAEGGVRASPRRQEQRAPEVALPQFWPAAHSAPRPSAARAFPTSRPPSPPAARHEEIFASLAATELRLARAGDQLRRHHAQLQRDLSGEPLTASPEPKSATAAAPRTGSRAL